MLIYVIPSPLLVEREYVRISLFHRSMTCSMSRSQRKKKEPVLFHLLSFHQSCKGTV